MLIPKQRISTIDEFFAALRNSDARFVVQHGGAIRTRGNECPVCALVNRMCNTSYGLAAWTAAGKIGMSPALVARIVNASDCDTALKANQRIRRRLLHRTLRASSKAKRAMAPSASAAK